MPEKPGHGAVAQLGEHLLCKQGVVGSIPISSTSLDARKGEGTRCVMSAGGMPLQSSLIFASEGCLLFNNLDEVCALPRAKPRGGAFWVIDCMIEGRGGACFLCRHGLASSAKHV